MHRLESIDYLKAHAKVSWLRPESALCDAIASTLISRYEIRPPSLDLGCGNGLFSFITAGGDLAANYDWYVHADPKGFWEHRDIYNVFKGNLLEGAIEKAPLYRFTHGLDHKNNLLQQAQALKLYENLIHHDANIGLPFEDGCLQTLFSNILYWLKDPKRQLRELYRVLKKGALALLCLPNKKFFDYCLSYQWEEKDSVLLKKLNRGRSNNMLWTTEYEEFCRLANDIGFKVVGHDYYLSKLTLTIWDIGLRPLSPVLIKMANALSPENRVSIKAEWIEIILDLLAPLYEMEFSHQEEKGFHFFALKKV